MSTLDRWNTRAPVFHIHFDFVKIWGYRFPPPIPPPPPALLSSPNSAGSSSRAIVVMWTCKWIYYKYNLLSLFSFACMNVLLRLTTIIDWVRGSWLGRLVLLSEVVSPLSVFIELGTLWFSPTHAGMSKVAFKQPRCWDFVVQSCPCWKACSHATSWASSCAAQFLFNVTFQTISKVREREFIVFYIKHNMF